MLIGGMRRILPDANVHRLCNRDYYLLSGVAIDEARRAFEEDILWVLDAELVLGASPGPRLLGADRRPVAETRPSGS